MATPLSVLGQRSKVRGGLTLTGDKELERRLKRLTDREFLRTVKAASAKAATPIVKKTRANVKEDDRSGLLAKSIGKKTKEYKRAGIVITFVGARRGFKDPETGEDPANIFHLVEEGTEAHYIAPKAKKVLSNINDPHAETVEVFGPFQVLHPGTDPKRPLERAFNSEAEKTGRVYKAEMEKGIDKIAAKVGAKL